MLRVTADKIASATRNVALTADIRLEPQICAEEGYVIAGRIWGEKGTYNTIENCNGRMVSLHDGDILVGALGRRDALHGYCGFVPKQINVGDRLNVLNLGGVIGKCSGVNPELGAPFEFEVLGSVLVFPDFQSRSPQAAHVTMNKVTLSCAFDETTKLPVVYVLGTCMNSGKTSAACRIIRELDQAGLKVAACKLNGVSLLRDTLNMQDHGAKLAMSFMDAGVVTTSAENAVPAAESVIGALSQSDCQVIVAELGDGVLGRYGVAEILSTTALMQRAAVLVLCANDPVGAWGAVEILRDKFSLNVDVVSGPTTDNQVGIEFVSSELRLAAINARTDGKKLGTRVLEFLRERKKI